MKANWILRLLATGVILSLSAPVWAQQVCDPDNPDADGDGRISIACEGGDDCDDTDPGRFPGNVEVCDALDHDEDCDVTTFGVRDADGDGFLDGSCCNIDVDGTRICGDDCDDGRPSSHPIANDVCDGDDNDCDGVVDQHTENQFADLDRDGHGDPNDPMGRVCAGSEGFSPLSNDCDDSNPAIEPGSLVCDPGLGPDGYKYCASDGQFVTGNRCAAGSVCIAQDNGTGVCVPEKIKQKDKNNS